MSRDDWQQTTIRALVAGGVLDRPMDGNHGELHPKKSDFVAVGIPFIMASDLVDGRVDTQNCAFISKEMARSLRKGFARAGDVLISHKATMGRTAIIGEIDTDYVMLTPQVTYYRVTDTSKLEPRFLKYYFDSREFQTLFGAWGNQGSTRSYLGIGAQLDLPAVVPPIGVQRAIASILGALDDKIELNRRMNETLEGLARALFDDAFGDGDLDAALGDLASIERHGVDPQDHSDEWFDHYSLPAFDEGACPALELGTDIKSNKFVLAPGCVLLSKLNPSIPRVWFPRLSETRRSIASTEFLVLRPTMASSAEYLNCLLRTDAIREHLIARASGTSNSHQRVKPDDLLSTPVHRPTQVRLAWFNDLARPLFERVSANLGEASTLADTRDALLPKLLSGELRAHDLGMEQPS